MLRHLADIVVTLLHTQTRETQRRLPSSAVLLGKFDSELMQYLSGVAAKCTEESSVTVHHNEPILVVGLQQLIQSLCVEFVVAEVQGGVDGLEGLEVDVDFLLLAVVCHDSACVHDEPIGRDSVVELQALLCGGDGAEHRLPVDAILDVRRRAELVAQHLRDAGYLITGGHNEADHGRAVTAGCLETFYQPLDLPHLDVAVDFLGGQFLCFPHGDFLIKKK
mmetsp:Transcript_14226/g.24090  ORF Transcript_14226/g.24090 Transcript_14226/m.24090 type:complete len:221 (-) Transcript_14226:134-796(-)